MTGTHITRADSHDSTTRPPSRSSIFVQREKTFPLAPPPTVSLALTPLEPPPPSTTTLPSPQDPAQHPIWGVNSRNTLSPSLPPSLGSRCVAFWLCCHTRRHGGTRRFFNSKHGQDILLETAAAIRADEVMRGKRAKNEREMAFFHPKIMFCHPNW